MLIIDANEPVQQWTSRSPALLETVSQFRVGDDARFLVPAMQAHASWTSSPMSTHAIIENVPYRNLAGITTTGPRNEATYQVIDYKASFTNAKALGQPLSWLQKRALRLASQRYGTGPTSGMTPAEVTAANQAKVHKDVMDSVKLSKELHEAPLKSSASCPCCVVM